MVMVQNGAARLGNFMADEFEDEITSIKQSHLEELRFYGFAGMYIIRFQQIEDHLEEPFAKLAGLEAEEATIASSAIRTVSRRCQVIRDLVAKNHALLADDWSELQRRILRAENERNSIAHGSPTYGGQNIVIRIDQETGETSATAQNEPHFWLEKNGFENWTTEKLAGGVRAINQLQSDLFSFSRKIGAIQ